MFAIVETGGKQYRVSVSDRIFVDNVPTEPGSHLILDRVLFIKKENGSIELGKPFIESASVAAELVSTYKDKKVIAFKKRRRKNSRRKRGHRQQKSELRILSINFPS